jgi:hypothetical protein
MNSGNHYFVIFRNYSALNLVIKIPLQKGLISIMLPHDSFLRFQLPFAKGDLKLSKKTFIPKYTE